jgi:hypothetical protein
MLISAFLSDKKVKSLPDYLKWAEILPFITGK